MDRIREERLLLNRRVEGIINGVERNEARTQQAIQQISASNPTSIGPANDLLRFFYILEQQNQSDTNEVRAQTRENLLDYINQFRSPEDVDEQGENDEEQDEEEEEDQGEQQDEQNDNQQPVITTNPIPVNPRSITTVSQPLLVTPPVPPPTQPSTVAFIPPQPSTPVQATASSQPPPPSPSLLSTTEPDHIIPQTLVAYNKLLFKARQYEARYSTVVAERKKKLAGPLKAIINRLREETFRTLTDELLMFLNGQEQIVLGQPVRISSQDERLLCLSMIASLIFNQLLGGDLDDTKTKILIPLVVLLSENSQHQEFREIFLDRLHKKCPYTVPYYPKRQPTMTDKQYREALGYIERKEGDQIRLETDNEFLNRMSGLIRFFCKLLIRRGPPFDSQLDYAWRWMSDMMNLPPRPNITAILFRIFLEETGDSMLKEYSKQFVKIIGVVREKYLPRIRQATTDDQMTRLQLTLDTLKTKAM